MISLLEKGLFPSLASAIFSILDGNMRKILPDRLSYEEEYAMWYEAVSQGLQRNPRQIILVQNREGRLLGFLQYYANDQVLMLEEMQILPELQRKANFLPRLWKFLLEHLQVTPTYVEAFSHPRNTDSIALQEKLGMECIERGDYYHYRGSFARFARRK